ncbi:MAG: nitroreductase family protein [Pseudomonadota bacterium]
MANLNLNADEVLTTTRAVRKRLDFDRPVEMDILRECLDIALQAPSGSNSQGWQFMLVTDTAKIATIAEYYRQAFAEYEASDLQPTAHHKGDPVMEATQERVLSSAQYLAQNLHRVPALLIPCAGVRPDIPGMPLGAIAGILGSIVPAVWSFMLAARERGIGTCWTTLHLNFEKEVAALLDIPDEVAQVALIPIAYTLGTEFKAAPRTALDKSLHINSW